MSKKCHYLNLTSPSLYQLGLVRALSVGPATTMTMEITGMVIPETIAYCGYKRAVNYKMDANRQYPILYGTEQCSEK